MITASTLTDDQIHEHLDWLTNQLYLGKEQRRVIREGIHDCAVALGTVRFNDIGRVQAIREARERGAAAINVRRQANEVST